MYALPSSRALAVGRALGWVFGSVIRYHRQDAFEALARSLPDQTEAERKRIVRSMYANLGMNLVETARLRHLTPEQASNLAYFDHEERVHEALARGKGVIVLTAHVGSWDLLCTLTPAFGYPITVITKLMRNKALHDLWIDIRTRFGVRFLPPHNSYRPCLAALRRKELIGFILDQNMIDKEGVFVDFFGRPACTSPGLAYLAAHAQCPVLPAFATREPDGRHRIRILPALDPPPDRKPETIAQSTQTYTRIIEDVVRAFPDQWIWIHRRWKTQPKQEPPQPLTPARKAQPVRRGEKP